MRRDPAALWRTAPGFLVLGRADREPITVTGPGADIWRLLAADPSLDALVVTLSDRYGADPAVVRADVEALLDRLIEAGFVVRGDADE